MLITVFRSRLKPGLRDEYAAAVARMNELAQTMPGYVSHKTYYAEDGERCTIVEFAHEDGLAPGAPIPSIGRHRKWREKGIIRSITFRFARLTANRSSRQTTGPWRRLDRGLPSPH